MTETTTFPFSALSDDTAGAEGDEARRPLAAILGGALLAVVLVGGAVLALTGGEEELPTSTGVTSTGAATSAEPPAETELAQTVPAANTELIARNPFEPKYVEPAPVPETPAQAPVTDPAALPPTVLVPGQPGAYVPAPGVVGNGTPTSSPTAPPTAPAPREYRLVLTGVSTEGGVPTASFTLDGAVSTVKATEIFGPQQQLLLRSLQQGPENGQWTATIQVGDARPIDVVTGEAVYVQ